ncbi:hypothetical protein D9758_008374 [Tetrapyrgos nigripes]|uniref:alpha-amylase n=1 Tax=Tetrapyrgos nigripes TaxID=182062 RepID=A0A8H5GE41_9AGAR|nr:hypothetical protein D9758_008374 [Tetrapyrgos nigripes]
MKTAVGVLALCVLSWAQRVLSAPDSTPGRDVIIQMFQWNWDSIAAECRDFIGPAGYEFVQVSPASEHVQGNQWWTDYQVVSYKLDSKRGNRQQFANMIATCHQAGVKVIVDTVFNHMAGMDSGVGVDGSSFTHYDYPGIWTNQNFHHCGLTSNDDIQDWNNRAQVQTCELVNLADLATETEYVRGRLAEHANDLLSLGADGLRIDAAKHMATDDIANILSRLQRQTYSTQEVIYGQKEEIQPKEYVQNGDVQDFRYTKALRDAFTGGGLTGLQNIMYQQDWLPSSHANVFVANHDTERSNGQDSLYYNSPSNIYVLATIFSLAHPYGTPTILSSYDFANNDDGGPNNGFGTCTGNGGSGGWLCQHRWAAVSGMVGWRKAVGTSKINNWYSPPNKPNQIAFGRGNKGFVAINNADMEWNLEREGVKTQLADGVYCDVVSGNKDGERCSGVEFKVVGGLVTATVPARGAIAIHLSSKPSSLYLHPTSIQLQRGKLMSSGIGRKRGAAGAGNGIGLGPPPPSSPSNQRIVSNPSRLPQPAPSASPSRLPRISAINDSGRRGHHKQSASLTIPRHSDNGANGLTLASSLSPNVHKRAPSGGYFGASASRIPLAGTPKVLSPGATIPSAMSMPTIRTPSKIPKSSNEPSRLPTASSTSKLTPSLHTRAVSAIPNLKPSSQLGVDTSYGQNQRSTSASQLGRPAATGSHHVPDTSSLKAGNRTRRTVSSTAPGPVHAVGTVSSIVVPSPRLKPPKANGPPPIAFNADVKNKALPAAPPTLRQLHQLQSESDARRQVPVITGGKPRRQPQASPTQLLKSTIPTVQIQGDQSQDILQALPIPPSPLTAENIKVQPGPLTGTNDIQGVKLSQLAAQEQIPSLPPPDPVPMQARRFTKPHPTLILRQLQMHLERLRTLEDNDDQEDIQHHQQHQQPRHHRYQLQSNISLDIDELIAIHDREQIENEGMMKDGYKEMLSWEKWREEEDGSTLSATLNMLARKRKMEKETQRLAVFAQPLHQISLYASTTGISSTPSKAQPSHGQPEKGNDTKSGAGQVVTGPARGYEHDLPIVVCKCVQELVVRGEAELDVILDNMALDIVRLVYCLPGTGTYTSATPAKTRTSKPSKPSERLQILIQTFNSSSQQHKFGAFISLAGESTEDVWALLERFLEDLPEGVVGGIGEVGRDVLSGDVDMKMKGSDNAGGGGDRGRGAAVNGLGKSALSYGISRALWEYCIDDSCFQDEPTGTEMILKISMARLLLRLLPSSNLSLFAYLMGFLSWVVESRVGTTQDEMLDDDTTDGIAERQGLGLGSLENDPGALELVRRFGRWMFASTVWDVGVGFGCENANGVDPVEKSPTVMMLIWFLRHWTEIESRLFDEIVEMEMTLLDLHESAGKDHDEDQTPRVVYVEGGPEVGGHEASGRTGIQHVANDRTPIQVRRRREDSDLLSLCSATSSALDERLLEANDVDSDIEASFSQLQLARMSLSGLPPLSAVDEIPSTHFGQEPPSHPDITPLHHSSSDSESEDYGRKLRVVNRAASDGIDFSDDDDSEEKTSSSSRPPPPLFSPTLIAAALRNLLSHPSLRN